MSPPGDASACSLLGAWIGSQLRQGQTPANAPPQRQEETDHFSENLRYSSIKFYPY